MESEKPNVVPVEEGVTPPAELLLTEVAEPQKEPEKPYVQRFKITVPAGHVMPLGESIKQPFELTVVAGVRWHPEWPEPQVTVNAYRFLSHGDALCWAGSKVLAFKSLLPEDILALVPYHGQPATEGMPQLDRLGLTPPAERQPLATFIEKR